MHAFRSCSLAALALSGFIAMPAASAELGFYVGFLYGDGSKEYDLDQFSSLGSQVYAEILDFSPEIRTYSQDSKGETYGFMGGYRLTQHIAFEGGYMYIGKQSYRETASGFFFPADPEEEPIPENWSLSLSSRTSGFALSALGIFPINYSWELYGRAGVLIGSNVLSVYADNGSLLYSDRFNESSTDWLAGAGISMSLAEVYAIRAEFTRIFDAGEPVFGEADVDLISLGITVSF